VPDSPRIEKAGCAWALSGTAVMKDTASRPPGAKDSRLPPNGRLMKGPNEGRTFYSLCKEFPYNLRFPAP